MKNLCDTCIHNTASDMLHDMDCEYVCEGVKEVKGGGKAVTKCEDYKSD